ncbi:phosphoribosylanthranilate isomerase [Alicyclobacillus sp.]|uniref:phosphoribosylanthranilate isomerase n=1 Tax=Alicyclobacillus sp. TaxID=61169 RepID=UPI0025C66882|nr:phosphoribosylanthranilate isomerase [Alicyclobacillus sp.]MCL6515550.1 phosphoribosylanthranilate isomerase [Alicyclobacillus sp.]
MTVEVKICGLQPGDDLSFTDHPRVTHVGWVFVAESRRYVAPKLARRMIDDLAGRAEPVGVFVNASREEILRVAEESGIRVAQLHGEETPALCAALRASGLRVWRSLAVRDDERMDALARRLAAFAGQADALLLDAAPPKGTGGVTGGHGRTYDWRVLPQAVETARSLAPALPAIWVAGGLTSANVSQLFRWFIPKGVDVSSGVETDGRKDPRRILAFLDEVDRAIRSDAITAGLKASEEAIP